MITEETAHTDKESVEAFNPNDDAPEAEPRLYELGYHIVPTVGEEGIGAEVTLVKDELEKLGGLVVSDEMPRVVRLAFPIAFVPAFKRGAETRVQYASAYFGWIKFKMPPANIAAFRAALAANEKVLRFLITHATLTKPIMAPRTMAFLSRTSASQRGDEPRERRATLPSLKEEDIDKTIEGLVVE
ncbi:MAG: 30S ribosomal protein S6 [Parcubacteria group bacterium]|nr:30S ribosomal protein S6 [Parcubacteria group bacterium]